MHSVVLAFIVTSASIRIKAEDEPIIEIYEIRKGNFDAADRGDQNLRADEENFDSGGLNGFELDFDALRHADNRDRQNRDKQNHDRRNRNKQVDLVANSLIDKLRKIVNSKQYTQHREDYDDYIASYKDLKKDRIFGDHDRMPVIFLANKNNLYHINPKASRNVNNKLQSILRTLNNDDEVENRTAPPGKRTRYDYEY